MKLSRRGKLARRGKHTKRAGKHLRYKTKSKKFRASKRYHRGNKRTYKRGKRFHRGGTHGFGDDIEPGSELSLTIASEPALDKNALPALDTNELPKSLQIFSHKLLMPNALNFEYKRTDGLYTLSKPITGLFDVVVTKRFDKLDGIYLLRRDKNDISKYDKYLYIPVGSQEVPGCWVIYTSTKPFSNIIGHKLNSSDKDGYYTFLPNSINRESFQAVKDFLKENNVSTASG
jgi:hypothetical protein